MTQPAEDQAMSIPRFRISVRWMTVLVAFMAVLSWGARVAWDVRRERLERAERAARAAQLLQFIGPANNLARGALSRTPPLRLAAPLSGDLEEDLARLKTIHADQSDLAEPGREVDPSDAQGTRSSPRNRQ